MRHLLWMGLAACTEGPLAPAVDGVPGSSIPEGPSAVVVADRTTPRFGGTLAVSEDGIVVADPGTDRIFVVDQDLSRVGWELPLAPGSEPFRVRTDGPLAFVTLRGTGELVVLDLERDEVRRSIAVCPEPRGLDLDDSSVFVACASGELVEFDRALELRARTFVADDLRDVVVQGETLYLSRFRSAEVWVLDRVTRVVQRQVQFGARPPLPAVEGRVAWRMRHHPNGVGVMVLHQLASTAFIDLNPPQKTDTPPYGEGGGLCSAQALLASTVLSEVLPHASSTSSPLRMGTPPPDFDVDGGRIWVPYLRSPLFGSTVAEVGALAVTVVDREACVRHVQDPVTLGPSDGLITSVAMIDGSPVLLTREPTAVHRDGRSLVLSPADPSVAEPFVRFHEATPSGMSCATCHPEVQDDGHTWSFVGLGPRRTQNIAGGIASRTPLHWDGEFEDFGELLDDVFVERMGGSPMPSSDVARLVEWMDGVPATQSHPLADAQSIARGEQHFTSPEVGCSTCHLGDALTDNALHQVRWGEAPLKTPSLLGVGTRAPYMHDGCALTLEDRFADVGCGGGDLHGETSLLSTDDLRDLIAYLRTL